MSNDRGKFRLVGLQSDELIYNLLQGGGSVIHFADIFFQIEIRLLNPLD